MDDVAGRAGLFAAAFGAATILPMQSEAALVGLLLTDAYPPWMLITVASVGNVLGSTINWMLGRGIERFGQRPWFPAKSSMLEAARRWYRGYGRWSLLLSWVPLIGDPLTVAAGVLREPLPSFVALVAVAKTARYLALAAMTLSWT